MRQTSATKREAIFNLRDGGMYTREIARELKMGQKTVRAILQEGPLCCEGCGIELRKPDPDDICNFCREERKLALT